MSKTSTSQQLSTMQKMYLQRFAEKYKAMTPDACHKAAAAAVRAIPELTSIDEINAKLIQSVELMNYAGLTAFNNKDAAHRVVLMVTGDFNTDGYYEPLPKELLNFLKEEKLVHAPLLCDVERRVIAVAVNVDAASEEGLRYQKAFNTGNTAVKLISEEATNTYVYGDLSANMPRIARDWPDQQRFSNPPPREYNNSRYQQRGERRY